MTLKLHNTLTRKVEDFTPISDDKVTLYTCGPTVYDYLTVGNWTAYVYWDTLVRALIASGYQVERVMNLTDVGHLVSDADEGEDKLEKGAAREGKTAWEIAEYYGKDFLEGMEKLGLLAPEHLVKATDFIPQQLDLIRELKAKGFTYQTTDGIYFDTSKFSSYADFAQLDLAAQRAGARVEANDQKRQPWDFALWKFTEPGTKRDMEWITPDDLLELPASSTAQAGDSVRGGTQNVSSADESILGADTLAGPAPSDLRGDSTGIGDNGSGERLSSESVMGFPGWHLECSAMAMSILGTTIDIHTGGIDHIPVHHTNEIAQSEAASGVRFANYWLHNNHLKIDGGKISKSLGNGYTLQDIEKQGYTALDLRMFILQGQYTNEGNFTFENLTAAKNRLANWRNYAALRHQTHDRLHDDTAKNDDSDRYVAINAATEAIRQALQDNLNTPEALRIIDEAFSKLDGLALERIHRASLVHVIETIDEMLGLQLEASTPDISDEAKRIIIERQRARENKNWEASDQLRNKLANIGVQVNDTPSGTTWSHSIQKS
ncbi:MAG: cysteine--tRNA ligase [Candidatus Saccharimonas sp.]